MAHNKDAVGVMSWLLYKRPGYVMENGQQCLKYLHGSAAEKLHYKSDGPIDALEVMVDASFGRPHEGYRSVQGIMMTHGGRQRSNPSSPKVQQKQSSWRTMRRINAASQQGPS